MFKHRMCLPLSPRYCALTSAGGPPSDDTDRLTRESGPPSRRWTRLQLTPEFGYGSVSCPSPWGTRDGLWSIEQT